MEGMDMIEEQGHLTKHRLEEENMNMLDSNIVELDDMDTLEEYFHPMNHRSEVEGIDTVKEHFHPMNHRPEVECMDTVNTSMGEDRAVELEFVEREPEGAVLVRHWIGDGAARHHRTHQEWEELVKSRCSKNQSMFATHDSNCSSS
jgi:hypothetical protein